MSGRQTVIIIKPAFLEASDFLDTTPAKQLPVPQQTSQTTASASCNDPILLPDTTVTTSRSGRRADLIHGTSDFSASGTWRGGYCGELFL